MVKRADRYKCTKVSLLSIAGLYTELKRGLLNISKGAYFVVGA